MRRRYWVSLYGCGITTFYLELTPEQFEFVEYLAARAEQASIDPDMPTLGVGEVSEGEEG